MEVFDADIKKDEGGRLTVIELPFFPREVFKRPKGTLYVSGTINHIEYRCKLLARGNGRFAMTVDKALQKALGYDGGTMKVHVTMAVEEAGKETGGENSVEMSAEPSLIPCGMDTLTAVRTRQSIRSFTAEPIAGEMLDTILCAGMYAPSAKNKRPCHFIVVGKRQILTGLSRSNPNAAMLETAACAIIVCGDKNREGMKEFLYADCAAAVQNMLLCIHSLGLGGVWCGVAAGSDWRREIAAAFALPVKIEPTAVIALGWPGETKEIRSRWEPEKIHYGQW